MITSQELHLCIIINQDFHVFWFRCALYYFIHDLFDISFITRSSVQNQRKIWNNGRYTYRLGVLSTVIVRIVIDIVDRLQACVVNCSNSTSSKVHSSLIYLSLI